MKRFLGLLLVALAPMLHGQSSESLEFPGPENAPIYVIEGNFSQNTTLGYMDVHIDWSLAMNPANGALGGTGLFSIGGSFPYAGSYWPISFNGAVGVALVAKQAGDALRVNGKMTLKGTGSIAGFDVDRCLVTYSYSNLSVNPGTGTMSGTVSTKGSARVPGYGTFPINLPSQSIDQPLPDADVDGQWDSTGDWVSEINATVDAKGKISGTGELSVLDEDGEPYDLIAQKVSGNVKNGIVTMAASGNSKGTSKIKVNLTYQQSDDEAVPNRSSVSAYGQSRKF